MKHGYEATYSKSHYEYLGDQMETESKYVCFSLDASKNNKQSFIC